MRFNQTCNFQWLSYVKLAVIATSVLLGLSGDLTAAQNVSEEKRSAVVSHDSPDEPKLSEIIPLSAELSGRLAKLENIKLDLPDLASIEKDYSEIDERINAVSKKLKGLRAKRTGQNVRDMRIKLNFTYENQHLKKINVKLDEVIDQLDAWDREWRREKEQWKAWQSTIVKDRSYRQILASFDAADSTIASALGFISRQMEPLLAAQSIGAGLKAKIDGLDAETTSLQGRALRREALHDKTSPMYSLDYYAQFNGDLWDV